MLPNNRKIKAIIFLITSIMVLFHYSTIVSAGTQDTVTIDVGTYPINKPVIVDGIIYTPTTNSRLLFKWERNSTHTISILEPVYYTGQGARSVFEKWSTGDTGESITVRVTEPSSIVAIYRNEYYVQVTSRYGNPMGSGWYREGSRANMSVEEIIPIGEGVRAVFNGWSNGQLPDNTENYIYVFSPIQIKANWKIQYKLNLESNINASLEGPGWYYEGQLVRINAQPSYNYTNNTQYRFDGWRVVSGSIILEDPSKPMQLITINGPINIRAVYAPYYLVTILSPYGSPPGNKYYKAGSTILVNLESPYQKGSTRWIFDHWSNGSRELPLRLVVNEPVTLVASWQTQYKLSIKSSVPSVSGDGWYGEGAEARINAPKSVPARLGVKYVFKGWNGDIKSRENSLKTIMDSPKQIEAIWDKSYTTLYTNIGVALVVIIGSFIGYRRVLLPRFSKEDDSLE